MKPSNELFELIKSLTKTEKAYIKKYSNIHVKGEGNDYVSLFDAIDKQDSYNEEQLKKSLKNKKLVQRLPKEKNYLYKFILKALRSYHTSFSLKNQLNNYLIDIEILHSKGLFGQEQKLMEAAKELAKDQDMMLHKLLILEAEDNLKSSGHNLNINHQDFLKLNINEINDIFNQYKYILKYRRLLYRVMEIDMKDGLILHNSESLAELEQIIAAAREDEPDNLTAIEAIRNKMIIYSYYHAVKGDYLKSYEYRKELVELLEQQPGKLKHHLPKYISAVYNLYTYCQRVGKVDEAEEQLLKLKYTSATCEKKISLHTKVMELYFNAELDMSFRTKNYERGFALLPGIEGFLKERADKVSNTQEFALYFNLSRLFVSSERYDDALPWLNLIINRQSNIMINIQSIARILNIIVHYELGNLKLLESLFRSTYRYLKNRKTLFPLEKVILDYIKNKLPYVTNQSELHASFIHLKSEITTFTGADDQIKKPDYFDFTGWLDKKIVATAPAHAIDNN